MPESSGFYYPNRIARAFFVAMDEVMGKQSAQNVLLEAGLDDYIDEYPPNNMDRQFDFGDLAALTLGLESLYGMRGGLGFAMSIGQAAFIHGLQSFGVMRGMKHPKFQALPVNTQVEYGLRGLASIFTNFSDQETEVHIDNDGYIITVDVSPFAWGRQSTRPVCHTLTGLIQESVKYTTNGHTCFVRETDCHATGSNQCVFKVKMIDTAPK